MKESPFGFSYSWSVFKPIRTLAIIVLIGQFIGMALGYALGNRPDWFINLWVGGAMATFPSFIVGVVVQYKMSPASIAENIIVVRRLAIIAFFLGAITFALPF